MAKGKQKVRQQKIPRQMSIYKGSTGNIKIVHNKIEEYLTVSEMKKYNLLLNIHSHRTSVTWQLVEPASLRLEYIYKCIVMTNQISAYSEKEE